jgi:hypothetical protein
MGVSPELIPVLASYLTNREMKVRFNNSYSRTHKLSGGGPQGTLIGLIEYFVQSNDNADCVDPDMRFKYVDDLTVLELVLLTTLLTEYNFKQHVASDIGTDEYYVPASSLTTQGTINDISTWTTTNQMKLNTKKSNYMILLFSMQMCTSSLKVCISSIEMPSPKMSRGIRFHTGTSAFGKDRTMQPLCLVLAGCCSR